MTDHRLGSLVAEVHGDGPAVVLIHGLGGSSNSFETLMPALDGYRAIRPDLPGAGRSALKPGRPGLEGLASAVRNVLRALNVDRAHLVGHSMGTLICQMLAAETPHLVSGMTLYGPILEPPQAARDALRGRAGTARRDGMAGIAEAVSTGSVSATARAANPVARAFVRESVSRQDPAGYASHCEALADMRPPDHAAITCPTLLVVGAEDPVAPVTMGEALRGRIAKARMEIIPDISHWATMEAPGRATDLLRESLDTTTNENIGGG